MALVRVTAYYAELVFAAKYIGCFPLAFAKEGRMFVCLERGLVEEAAANAGGKKYRIVSADFFLDVQEDAGYFAGTHPERDRVQVLTRKVYYRRVEREARPFIWWDEVRLPVVSEEIELPKYRFNPWRRI